MSSLLQINCKLLLWQTILENELGYRRPKQNLGLCSACIGSCVSAVSVSDVGRQGDFARCKTQLCCLGTSSFVFRTLCRNGLPKVPKCELDQAVERLRRIVRHAER